MFQPSMLRQKKGDGSSSLLMVNSGMQKKLYAPMCALEKSHNHI